MTTGVSPLDSSRADQQRPLSLVLGGTLVRFDGQAVPLATLRSEPGRFVERLSRAKVEMGHAECLCTDPPRRLVIRSRAGRFHLACWPGDGDKHRPGCEFHRFGGDFSGRSAYRRGAIVEDHTGVRIRFKAPLSLRGAVADASPTESYRAGTGEVRSTLGPLGLLHYLWEQAKLDTWVAGTLRRWGDCVERIRALADETWVNGVACTDLLYVVPPYRKETAADNDAEFATFARNLGWRGVRSRRGLILAEVKAIVPSTYGWRFKLAHTPRPLFASARLVDKLRGSYRSVFSTRRPAGSRQVGLFLVERTAKGNISVVDAALMLTTGGYIPGESSHEIVMAHRLVAAGRSFIKPLRYDGTSAIFPDFILTDTDPLTYVEVWGISGRESYEKRKAEKQAHYQRTDSPVIEWDTANPLPAIPPPPGRAPGARVHETRRT